MSKSLVDIFNLKSGPKNKTGIEINSYINKTEYMKIYRKLKNKDGLTKQQNYRNTDKGLTIYLKQMLYLIEMKK